MRGDAGARGRTDRRAAGVLTARPPWEGRRVVLGVTGGIAAYKAVQLARDLTSLGAEVDVVMTRTAREFVGALSFEALTGRPVHSELIEEGQALLHIRLAKKADVVCVAPATADFIARAAAGRSDDLLTAVVLATPAPVLVCPAMNDGMWANAQTAANVRRLSDAGVEFAGPASGPLAFGEGTGPGRMLEPEQIVEHVGRVLTRSAAWTGRRVVVTAGPTREPVDAVRVLSNRSSGRMGFAIAAAAWRRGADVLLITGPSHLPDPEGVEVQRVETAVEMRDAVAAALPAADALFMAAAVADFRPVAPAQGKMKKDHAPDTLQLEPAPDVLKETRSARRNGALIVGFALESENGAEYARGKLQDKALSYIVLNSAAEEGAGFDVETNRVTVFGADGSETEVPLMSKDAVADALLDHCQAALPPRA